MDQHPIQRQQKYSQALHATETGISSGLIGHLARTPTLQQGEQGWRSGEGARFLPMWPGFDSRTRRYMWIEFVEGCRSCSESSSPGSPSFLPPHSTKASFFKLDLEQWIKSHTAEMPLEIPINCIIIFIFISSCTVKFSRDPRFLSTQLVDSRLCTLLNISRQSSRARNLIVNQNLFICVKGKPPILDLVFALDASDAPSIEERREEAFNYQRELVASLLDGFSISFSGTRVSIVSCRWPYSHVNFYLKKHVSKECIMGWIPTLR